MLCHAVSCCVLVNLPKVSNCTAFCTASPGRLWVMIDTTVSSISLVAAVTLQADKSVFSPGFSPGIADIPIVLQRSTRFHHCFIMILTYLYHSRSNLCTHSHPSNISHGVAGLFSLIILIQPTWGSNDKQQNPASHGPCCALLSGHTQSARLHGSPRNLYCRYPGRMTAGTHLRRLHYFMFHGLSSHNPVEPPPSVWFLWYWFLLVISC